VSVAACVMRPSPHMPQMTPGLHIKQARDGCLSYQRWHCSSLPLSPVLRGWRGWVEERSSCGRYCKHQTCGREAAADSWRADPLRRSLYLDRPRPSERTPVLLFSSAGTALHSDPPMTVIHINYSISLRRPHEMSFYAPYYIST
jgi:hypothetical protein